MSSEEDVSEGSSLAVVEEFVLLLDDVVLHIRKIGNLRLFFIHQTEYLPVVVLILLPRGCVLKAREGTTLLAGTRAPELHYLSRGGRGLDNSYWLSHRYF